MNPPRTRQNNPTGEASYETSQPAQGPSSGRGRATRAGGGGILVVDDNLANLQALFTMLTSYGYDVRQAADGATALMLARSELPELILLDIVMPGMDGYQVCRQLKDEEVTRDIPIMFISALDEVVDKVRGFQLGAVDYITKPFQEEEVLARVQTHIALHQLRHELDQRAEELRASQHFTHSSLDALSAHIAVLDGGGAILAVNASWRRFADQNGLGWEDYGVGRNYLEVAEAATGMSSQGALEAATGIREVIAGVREVFRLEYPCHGPEQERWFVLRVTRFESHQGVRVVTSHEDISERVQAEEALQARTKELGRLVKELGCLYGISALIERPGISLEEILQGTVELIPPAWQYAEVACARIILDDQVFESENFQPAALKQVSDLVVHGERSGRVEVRYLERRPPGDEGPFLKEERVLLDAIAEHLGRTVARLRSEEELRRHVVELSTLHSIAGMVATIADLPQALQSVSEVVASLFNARVSLVTVPDVEGGELQVLAGFERSSGGYATTTEAFPLHEMPVTRGVLEQGQTVVVPDLQALPLAAPVRAYVSDRGLHALMLVPLKAWGAVIGLLALGTEQAGQAFSPVDVALAETIAGDVAAAVENARLAEQAQAAAVDAERQRLARELHDSVTQSLYSVTLLANGWETMARRGTLTDVPDHFKQIGEVGQQALKEMRLLIHQLRPPVLEEVGLVGALQGRLDSVEQRTGVESQLLIQGQADDLPLALQVQLFHIAQEALNNALRHAHATCITVRVQAEEGQLSLSVEDDGIGFDAGGDFSGMGLVTMRERAEQITGKLSISSEPERGTTVKVTVALEADREVE